MTPAQTILKLIESVDPSDTAKLDEIDARVWCLTHGQEYVGRNVSGEECFRNGYNGMTPTSARKARKYTRSRDALKAIRPEGFVWQHLTHYEGFSTRAELNPVTDKSIVLSSPRFLPTEELAELHAIIQAIEHERS
jgi:hypothetical protein